MTKPILVVTSRYTKEIEDRIDRDYKARRNPDQFPLGIRLGPWRTGLAAGDMRFIGSLWWPSIA